MQLLLLAFCLHEAIVIMSFDSNALLTDSYFFENGEKKISVFKNTRISVDRASEKIHFAVIHATILSSTWSREHTATFLQWFLASSLGKVWAVHE